MQTTFSSGQLADPEIATSKAIIQSCVHCGFCLATCPTYLVLGDELDSPRGRIYQIKEMLEQGGPPAPSTVRHLDRCLSCLACMTTCPSGVNYMHLIDQARAYIETHHRRPLGDRLLRALLARVLTRSGVLRAALRIAILTRPLHRLLPGRLRGVAAMAPGTLAARDITETQRVFKPAGTRRARVALLSGCAQPVLAPQINAATIRLLNRLGVEVVIAARSCCGALPYHLGRQASALELAKANIAAWSAELQHEGLDAVLINTSGCGTTVKDYGFMFRNDPLWAGRAARVAALARDVSELLLALGPPPVAAAVPALRVAYHSACSLQHGQSLRDEPLRLLRAAGFTVVEPAESHLCCGSAGTYNLLQPGIAGQLRERKVRNLMATAPQVIATGNLGCMQQIAAGHGVPVVHLVELLDWAAGGAIPEALRRADFENL
jgi:glycolate oxidase iron-sulfur subunit